MKAALLIVDIQNDFCAGGVLPARDTDSLIAPLNGFILECASNNIHLVYTRDWHPENHSSFSSQGGPWPRHCVQGSRGAAFVAGLIVPEGSDVIDKGFAPYSDGYSDFEDTDLDQKLRDLGVTTLGVCGIATEYCVFANVRDALERKFEVSVLCDLVRPINAKPDDASQALRLMRESGATLTTCGEWLRGLSSE